MKYYLGDEDHYNQNIKVLFANLIDQFKHYDNNFDCLFLEHSPEMQPLLDSFNNGTPVDDILDQAVLDGTLKKPKTYIRADVLNSANTAKINLFTYDFNFDSDEGRILNFAYNRIFNLKKYSAIDVNNYIKIGFIHRNFAMSQNIALKIQANQCKRSIVVTGSGHMTRDLSYFGHKDPIETLGDHLEKEQINVSYYLMRSAHCNELTDINKKACSELTNSDFILGSGVVSRSVLNNQLKGMFIVK